MNKTNGYGKYLPLLAAKTAACSALLVIFPKALSPNMVMKAWSMAAQGWELPVRVEATPGRDPERLMIVEAPLCPRMLDVREKHTLLFQHALGKIWTSCAAGAAADVASSSPELCR